MLRTRKCAVSMMACAIAAGLSLSSTVWADALAQLQYPVALGTSGANQVNIAPTYASNGSVTTGAAIDFALNGAGTTFGGLVVTQSNFNFLAPNGGTGAIENGGIPVSQGGTNPNAVGFQAFNDAVGYGGQSGASFASGPNSIYPTSPTNIGFVSSYATTESSGLTVVATLDNTTNQPGQGSQFYTQWRGINLSNLGDVALISPTWLGDADLNGVVDNNDLSNWAYGNSIPPNQYASTLGANLWFYGDFDNNGVIDNNDLSDWAYANSVTYNLNFLSGGFGGPGVVSPSAVPEPATLWLAACGGLCLLGMRLRRRVCGVL